MNIHVSNLSLNYFDKDLKKMFSAFGEVESSYILRDKFNGRSKGVGFVTMLNDKQAFEAIRKLDQTMVDGKSICVSELKFSLHQYKN